RRDDLAQQHRAHRPLGAEPETLERAHDEHLLVVLHEAANEGKYREPKDRELQYSRPAKPVAQPSADPPAQRRGEKVDARDEPSFRERHAEGDDKDWDEVGVDDPVGHIHRPAGATGPENAASLLV